MTGRSPEQVICDYFSDQRLFVAAQPAPGTTGWRAETSTGGFAANPATFHCGKARRRAHAQVHVVTFETQAGRKMRLLCCVRQDKAGAWQVVGGACLLATDGIPQRGHPWVMLGGGGPRPFYAGGDVLEHGAEIVRVRLRAANGTVLEDTVDADGVVLFLTAKHVHRPVYAELLDRSGQVVHQQHVWASEPRSAWCGCEPKGPRADALVGHPRRQRTIATATTGRDAGELGDSASVIPSAGRFPCPRSGAQFIPWL